MCSGNQRTIVSAWVGLTAKTKEASTSSSPSGDAGPFDLLADRQREHHVRHCLERLSNEHRECMHLVFFEGMSLGEVAQLQACPEGTVKTRMFHARQKLRTCLSLMLKAEGA